VEVTARTNANASSLPCPPEGSHADGAELSCALAELRAELDGSDALAVDDADRWYVDPDGAVNVADAMRADYPSLSLAQLTAAVEQVGAEAVARLNGQGAVDRRRAQKPRHERRLHEDGTETYHRVVEWSKPKLRTAFREFCQRDASRLLSPSDVLTLLVLLDHFDAKTLDCWVGVRTMELETHLARTTVIRCLDRLQATGIVVKFPGHSGSGRDATSRYVLRPVRDWGQPSPIQPRGSATLPQCSSATLPQPNTDSPILAITQPPATVAVRREVAPRTPEVAFARLRGSATLPETVRNGSEAAARKFDLVDQPRRYRGLVVHTYGAEVESA
jgi:hypothetical protein